MASEWQWFHGDFQSWADACRDSVGYADRGILDRAVTATRKVVRGEAAFERDGSAFLETFRNGPLVRALTLAASKCQRLVVLDFGGSLGSAYWQNRGAVDALGLEWVVVEQPHFVAVGVEEFQNSELRFCGEFAAGLEGRTPTLAVASGVLQYLEDPWAALDRLLGLAAPYVFLDRIPLLPDSASRLVIERVPPELGETSYPAWFLEEERFLRTCAQSHEIVERFDTRLEDGSREAWNVFGRTLPNQGLILARK